MVALQKIDLSRILFALGMCGLGVVTAFYGDFALQWQPIPKTLPGYNVLAYVSAALLTAGGIALVTKVHVRAALMLACYLCVFWLPPQLLSVVPAYTSIASWLGFCEVLGVTCGAVIIWAGPARAKVQRTARVLFGLCCIVYGISHFAYPGFTADMIPHWLPQRLALAYVTGAAHVVAGLAIACRVLPRLAALLEAVMMSLFVVLLHLPSLWASPPPAWAPTLRVEITALFWATSLAASAWVVARSLPRRS